MHLSAWPAGASADSASGDPAVLAAAGSVLAQVRKAKTAAKLSIRAEASSVLVRGPSESVVRASESDLRAAGNIGEFSFEHVPGGELTAEVTLAEAVGA